MSYTIRIRLTMHGGSIEGKASYAPQGKTSIALYLPTKQKGDGVKLG